MAASITEQQILDAINAARKHDDSNPHGALTCKEIAKISGMTRGWANRKITELIESGVLKITKVCGSINVIIVILMIILNLVHVGQRKKL